MFDFLGKKAGSINRNHQRHGIDSLSTTILHSNGTGRTYEQITSHEIYQVLDSLHNKVYCAEESVSKLEQKNKERVKNEENNKVCK